MLVVLDSWIGILFRPIVGGENDESIFVLSGVLEGLQDASAYGVSLMDEIAVGACLRCIIKYVVRDNWSMWRRERKIEEPRALALGSRFDMGNSFVGEGGEDLIEVPIR